MDEIDLSFGQRLRKARNRKDVKLNRLAYDAGLTPKYCGELERGNVGVSLSNAYRLAHALGVSLDHIVGEPLGPSTAKVLRDSASLDYRAPSSLFRIIASVRGLNEDQRLEVEDFVKLVQKRAARKARRKGTRRA